MSEPSPRYEREQTTVAMKELLTKEIQWPCDEEFENNMKNFYFFRNFVFEEAVCVVDGTEIRVSRPSKEPYQRNLWSGKKKQHFLEEATLPQRVIYQHTGWKNNLL